MESIVMSNDFETWEGVDAYAAEHGGVDGLRMMVAQGIVQGKRKSMIEYYLRQYDAATVATEREEQAWQSLKLSERSAIASEKSAAAAEQSAQATDRAATASERSARYAMCTAIIAGVAIIVTVVIDLYRQHS